MHRITFTILLLYAGLCIATAQDNNEPLEKKWAIGVEYKPFNYKLHNYGIALFPRHQLNKGNFQSAYYGIKLRRIIKENYFVEAGLGYSDHIYKDRAAGKEVLQSFEWGREWDRKNTVKTKNLHGSLGAGYQYPLNKKKTIGVDIRLGLLTSYNIDYFIHFIRYEFSGKETIIEGPVNLVATEVPHDYMSIEYEYNDVTGTIKPVDTTVIERPYMFNRFTVGVEAGVSVYFILSERLYLSPGIWINRDFTTTVKKEFTPDQYMYNRRWGVSLEVAYMF